MEQTATQELFVCASNLSGGTTTQEKRCKDDKRQGISTSLDDGESVTTFDQVTKVQKCRSCEKLFEFDKNTISCDECQENEFLEVKNITDNEISSNNNRNDTEAENCCCRCHHAESDANLTQATDTVMNVEVSCDLASQTTIVLPNSPNIDSTSERTCRICLDTADQEQLIAPCKCSGSTKYAHEECLLKWFFKSSKKSCEVCLGNVNVMPMGYKPMQQWRLPDRGCDFIVYLFGLYFLIMVIFTGMITWIATQGCTSPVCVTLYAVCGIALMYFFYCCGCVEYSRRYWRALLSVNRNWRIYGREDSLKNFKHMVTPKLNKRDIIAVHTPDVLLENRNSVSPYIIEINEQQRTCFNNECNSRSNSRYNMQVTGQDNQAVDLSDETLEQAAVTVVADKGSNLL